MPDQYPFYLIDFINFEDFAVAYAINFQQNFSVLQPKFHF
jgi:hypothetical protein